jgi:RimJ/RimL family protein N-acetyltransferase
VRVRRAEGALGLRERSAIDLSLLFDLRLRTERLELRLPTEDELVEFAHVAEHGVHPPEFMPFQVAWTDAIGTPEFVAGFTDYHRKAREDWSPAFWNLLLGVWAGPEPIGIQGSDARDFITRRTAETGSWLGQRFQGQGYGTEMRTAILELLFRGFGAVVATSGALAGNIASARVSEKLGYEHAGERFVEPRGEPVREQRLKLTRKRWESLDRVSVEIAGLEPCLPLFGL